MKNIYKIIPVVILALFLLAACSSLIEKVGSGGKRAKESRPFQKTKFDSKVWLEGDAQTRGEMADDLYLKQGEGRSLFLNNKSRQQILELLGEPNRKTRGLCCGGGEGRGTFEREVWLYDLEVMDGSKMKTEHFQIYFHPSAGADVWRIANWDEGARDYIPRVG